MVVATRTRQRGLMNRKIIDLPVLMEHFEIHNQTARRVLHVGGADRLDKPGDGEN